jgi:hypothetical protein
MIKRVFLLTGIAACAFSVGFWYFVAGLGCGLNGAGGCSNYLSSLWKYPLLSPTPRPSLGWALPSSSPAGVFVSAWLRSSGTPICWNLANGSGLVSSSGRIIDWY